MKENRQNPTSIEQHLRGRVETEIELARLIEQLKTEKAKMKTEREELEIFFILSCSAFATTLVWYLYWILYDVIIWNKSFLQVSPVNYFGLAAMAGLILFEAKITIHRTPHKSVKDAKLEKVLALPLKIGECPHNINYFDQPNRAKEIPGECIECSRIIDCACRSSKAKENMSETITQNNQVLTKQKHQDIQ